MSGVTRPLGLTDLPLLSLAGRTPFNNHAITLQHGSTSPARRPRLTRLLRQSLQPGGREVWINRDGLSLLGLAAARPRSGPSAWEIDSLVLSLNSEAFVLDLLERCIATAGARGAHRLFLRLVAGSDLLPVARRQGFAAAGAETLLGTDAGPAPESGDESLATDAWRQRTRGDDLTLFRIFSAGAPQEIRWQTALTPGEWRAALDPLGRGAREWVRDDPAGTALLRVSNDRGRLRAGLIGPDHAEVALDAVAALRRLARDQKHRRGIEILLPDHLPVLANSFRELGFQDLTRYELSARPIAQRTQRLQLAERSVEGTVRPVVQ